MIRASDRVSAVLAANESLIDVFTSLSPIFERLRNPAMRKVMTRLVTVEQAARMGGVEIDTLLDRLNGHATADTPSTTPDSSVGIHVDATHSDDTSSGVRPAALARISPDMIVTADVREELRAGREPFSIIMAARATVKPGGALCVRATFEPVPLYAVMQKQHLAHWTERRAEDDWVVWFYADTRSPEASASAAPDAVSTLGDGTSNDNDDGVVVLDVRGLEPPEPMIRTLAALEELPAGGTLVQINIRVPKFLLPLLEERGFSYDIREQGDVVRLFISRIAAT
ncbi:MAG TPA: DUF2249 domain-containing protein [Longimicrobiales bacterium]